MGSQRQDRFLNLKRMRDREVSVHTTHTSRSHSRSGSHVSHGENTRNMQLGIDHLRRKLRCKKRGGTPSSSESHFNDDDDSYRSRSRTPPSEYFSCDEDCHYRRKRRSPSRRGLGMMQLVGPCAKFPNHRSHGGLKGENFPGNLLSQHLPCIMVGRIQWSMLAILIRE